MAAPTKTADELVDRFVSYLNATGFEPKSSDEVPEELRESGPEHGMFHWRIRPAAFNPWVETLGGKLPQSWPTLLGHLLTDTAFAISRSGL